MNGMNNITVFDGEKDTNYKVIDIFAIKGVNYIVFADSDGVYASRYKIEKGNFVFNDIESEEEWQMINSRIGGLANYE